jgi:class 3 adenylate cyclase
MEPSRNTTVLFADVSGSTKLYETAGDAAALEAIGNALKSCAGRRKRTAGGWSRRSATR